ncbi:MAG: Sec-independent protein translocase protein TatB [Gammaproteobacteria bacterium]|nr:Sec-independent protein translocase protein TatB [Gammaproteobacteria bacterium]
MFDIGFWELVLIAVVALVVVGPERFPGMVKKAGYWVGQFRRMVNSVKSEIQLEVDKAEELQRKIEEQKDVLERNIDLDVTTPAVKRKSVEEVEASTKKLGELEAGASSAKADTTVPK